MKYIIPVFALSLMLICCGNKSGSHENLDTQKLTIPREQVVAKSQLPSFEITLLDGTKMPVNKLTGKVALVMFQPDCDHCQREAQDIRLNLAGFKDYKLYFISSADIKEIGRFSSQYKLDNLPNVFFARTESENVIKAFGPIETPSIYLYANGSLIESFNGEVAIEVVLKYI